METFPLKMSSAYGGPFRCSVRWALDNGRVVQEPASFFPRPRTFSERRLCPNGYMMSGTLGAFDPSNPALIGWRPGAGKRRYIGLVRA